MSPLARRIPCRHQACITQQCCRNICCWTYQHLPTAPRHSTFFIPAPAPPSIIQACKHTALPPRDVITLR
uniref:Uncharacterized protein n=1 Tax=Ixodes ricinus TaxID=34613 RepID=A0A6B0TXE5_IXORI